MTQQNGLPKKKQLEDALAKMEGEMRTLRAHIREVQKHARAITTGILSASDSKKAAALLKKIQGA